MKKHNTWTQPQWLRNENGRYLWTVKLVDENGALIQKHEFQEWNEAYGFYKESIKLS